MQRHWFTVLVCASITGVTAGCAPILPPAVMIASQAIDGISYITTGKSGTDHILSAALEEDCAIHRIVTGGAVCQAEASGDIAATNVIQDSVLVSGDDIGGDAIDEDFVSSAERVTAASDSFTAPRPAGESVLPGAPPPASDEAWDENLAKARDPAQEGAHDVEIPPVAPIHGPVDDDSAAFPALPTTAVSIA